MGDMADYTNEMLEEGGRYFASYRSRRVSRQSTKTCGRCGQGELKWAKRDGRWVLVARDGELHVCKNRENTADGFEDEPV